MARMYHLSWGRVVVWNWDSRVWKSWAYWGSRVVVVVAILGVVLVVIPRREVE